MSNQVNFYFDNEEAASTFFEWWQTKIQKQFLEESKYDDYKYTIENYEIPEEMDEELKSFISHAIRIKEEMKSEKELEECWLMREKEKPYSEDL